jgi:hypothetical protein
MQRVLDIDLDFFGYEPVYWPDTTTRPDPADFPVWPHDEALDFLRSRCGLTGALPGFLTENHGELFALWRSAIDERVLQPPFHVTHVDMHADLGYGDPGYEYLMTELLAAEVDDRRFPRVEYVGLGDGNFLAFAIACHWISSLEYVFGDGGGSDELHHFMENFDQRAANVQLKQTTLAELRRTRGSPGEWPTITRFEPKVPYRALRNDQYVADAPFDFICLTRSPPYIPQIADPLYDVIRGTFMDVRFQSPESMAVEGDLVDGRSTP